MFKRALMAKNEERIRIKPALVNAWYIPKYESVEPQISAPLFKPEYHPDIRLDSPFDYRDHNSDLNPKPVLKHVKGVIQFKKYSSRVSFTKNQTGASSPRFLTSNLIPEASSKFQSIKVPNFDLQRTRNKLDIHFSPQKQKEVLKSMQTG